MKIANRVRFGELIRLYRRLRLIKTQFSLYRKECRNLSILTDIEEQKINKFEELLEELCIKYKPE
jgi:hypothetical protein